MYLIYETALALCLAFINIIIIHTIKCKFPIHYFSLGQIIINEHEDITIIGIFTKFLPPLVISIFLGFFKESNSLESSLLFTFFASFLVIWPVILSKNELLSWEARKKINILYVIYTLYISQYMILGAFGNFIGVSIKHGVKRINILSFLEKYDNLSNFNQNIIAGLIASAMFSIMILIVNKIYKLSIMKLKKVLEEDRRKRYEAFSDNK